MRILSFMLLFVAAAASAQPYVYPEVTSWTMDNPGTVSSTPRAALSLARDANGIVIAWSAGPPPAHVFVARLDNTLRVVDGTMREIAPATGYSADFPKLGAGAGTCALAWQELPDLPTVPRVNVFQIARLTPNLDFAAPPFRSYLLDGNRVSAGFDNNDTVVFGAKSDLYAVDPKGSVKLQFSLNNTLSLDDAGFLPWHFAFVVHLSVVGTPCRG